MEEITAYVAGDGTLHRSAQACTQHEATCALQPGIEAFLDSERCVAAARRKAGSGLIMRWEAFKVTGVNPAAAPSPQGSLLGNLDGVHASPRAAG